MAYTLTAKDLRTPQNIPNGVHTLERGIYLRVNGSRRSWIFKYSLSGKRREIGLGGLDQPMDAVRAKAYALKAQVAQGVDPAEVLRKRRAAEKMRAEAKKAPSCPTFRQFCPSAVEHIKFLRQWRGVNTESCWSHVLSFAVKAFGDKTLDDITTADVETLLKLHWNRSLGSMLQRCLSTVFDYARSLGLIKDNPAVWRGLLDARLPSPSTLARGKVRRHHRASSAEELRTVTAGLLAEDTVFALCLVFGILTVGRAGEYRKLKWSEIDFEAATATIPPERRKDKRPEPFVVPLSRQALTLLKKIPRSGEYVFTSRGTSALSHTSIWQHLQKAGGASVHGARSTFSDWCAKNEKNFLVSEKCLMHAVGNQVFRAYQRDDLLEQRRALLQEWADFILPDADSPSAS